MIEYEKVIQSCGDGVTTFIKANLLDKAIRLQLAVIGFLIYVIETERREHEKSTKNTD